MEDTTRLCTDSEMDVCECVYGDWYSVDCQATGECIDGMASGIEHFYRDIISG